MKYLLIFSLTAFSVCQLISIQAAPDSRHKRWAAKRNCPENGTTADECLDYIRRNGFGGDCARIGTDGKTFAIYGCGFVECHDVCGKKLQPVSDLTKLWPDCCPKCPELSNQDTD